MGFQVPASKASKGQDQFEFTIGTATFSVTKAKFVPIGELERLEVDGNAALAFFGAEGTKQGAAVRGLDSEQFSALVQAWNDDSEISSGESLASAS